MGAMRILIIAALLCLALSGCEFLKDFFSAKETLVIIERPVEAEPQG